jgi:hypothetical protein
VAVLEVAPLMSPYRRHRLSDRHPFEVYLLAISFASSLPAALGIAKVPSSVAQQMPGWYGRAWAVSLTVGCGIALLGLAWHRPPYPLLSVTGLGLEQVGLTIVGAAAVVYSVAAVTTVGEVAYVPGGMIFAFGLACFAQVLKIRHILNPNPQREPRRWPW